MNAAVVSMFFSDRIRDAFMNRLFVFGKYQYVPDPSSWFVFLQREYTVEVPLSLRCDFLDHFCQNKSLWNILQTPPQNADAILVLELLRQLIVQVILSTHFANNTVWARFLGPYNTPRTQLLKTVVSILDNHISSLLPGLHGTSRGGFSERLVTFFSLLLGIPDHDMHLVYYNPQEEFHDSQDAVPWSLYHRHDVQETADVRKVIAQEKESFVSRLSHVMDDYGRDNTTVGNIRRGNTPYAALISFSWTPSSWLRAWERSETAHHAVSASCCNGVWYLHDDNHVKMSKLGTAVDILKMRIEEFIAYITRFLQSMGSNRSELKIEYITFITIRDDAMFDQDKKTQRLSSDEMSRLLHGSNRVSTSGFYAIIKSIDERWKALPEPIKHLDGFAGQLIDDLIEKNVWTDERFSHPSINTFKYTPIQIGYKVVPIVGFIRTFLENSSEVQNPYIENMIVEFMYYMQSGFDDEEQPYSVYQNLVIGLYRILEPLKNANRRIQLPKVGSRFHVFCEELSQSKALTHHPGLLDDLKKLYQDMHDLVVY